MIINVWTFLNNNLKKRESSALPTYINQKVPLDSLHNNRGRHTSVDKHVFPPHDVLAHPVLAISVCCDRLS